MAFPLRDYQGVWEAAPVKIPGEFEIPKDGIYKVVIDSAKYTDIDKDGNPTDHTFIYEFTVMEGEYKGQQFRKYTTLKTDNEKNISFFKGDLTTLGMMIPKDIGELPKLITYTAGVIMEIKIKTRGYQGKEYKDIYFQKRLGKMNNVPQTQQQAMPQAQPKSRAYQPQQPQRQQPPAGYNEPPFNPNQYDEIPY